MKSYMPKIISVEVGRYSVVIFLACLFGVDANAQWLSSLSPPTSSITDFASYGKGLVISSSGAGIYLSSTPTGDSWSASNSGLASNDDQITPWKIFQLVASGNAIYAATARGAYASYDSGVNWKLLLESAHTLSASILVQGDTMLYAANTMMKSIDKGKSWSPAQIGLSTGQYKLARIGRIIYGVGQAGMVKSQDWGDTWIAVEGGAPSVGLYSISIYPEQMFVGGLNRIYTSTDSGKTWSTFGPRTEFNYIRDIIKLPKGILAAAEEGLFLSKDNGQTWNQYWPSDITQCQALHIHNGRLYFGTISGVGYSDTALTTMHSASNGIKGSIADIHVTNDEILAVSSNSLWVSKNRGSSWTKETSELANRLVLNVGEAGNNKYVTTDSGLFFRINNKWTWRSSGLSKDGYQGLTVTSLEKYLFVSKNGIYRSSDTGKSWLRIASEIRATNVTTFGSFVIAYTKALGISNERRIFRSQNFGATWDSQYVGLPLNGIFQVGGSGANLFASVYPSDAGKDTIVYKSGDSGKSWTGISPTTSVGQSLSIDGCNIIARPSLSIDCGATWRMIPEVPAGISILPLRIFSDTIWARSAAGIWKAQIPDKTQSIHPSKTLILSKLLLRNTKNGFVILGSGDTNKGDRISIFNISGHLLWSGVIRSVPFSETIHTNITLPKVVIVAISSKQMPRANSQITYVK